MWNLPELEKGLGRQEVGILSRGASSGASGPWAVWLAYLCVAHGLYTQHSWHVPKDLRVCPHVGDVGL